MLTHLMWVVLSGIRKRLRLTITVKEERTQIGQVNEAKQSEINQVN